MPKIRITLIYFPFFSWITQLKFSSSISFSFLFSFNEFGAFIKGIEVPKMRDWRTVKMNKSTSQEVTIKMKVGCLNELNNKIYTVKSKWALEMKRSIELKWLYSSQTSKSIIKLWWGKYKQNVLKEKELVWLREGDEILALFYRFSAASKHGVVIKNRYQVGRRGLWTTEIKSIEWKILSFLVFYSRNEIQFHSG